MDDQQFANVWDAVETTPGDAAVMKARSGLTIAIQETVAGWKLPTDQQNRRDRQRPSDFAIGHIIGRA